LATRPNLDPNLDVPKSPAPRFSARAVPLFSALRD